MTPPHSGALPLSYIKEPILLSAGLHIQLAQHFRYSTITQISFPMSMTGDIPISTCNAFIINGL